MKLWILALSFVFLKTYAETIRPLPFADTNRTAVSRPSSPPLLLNLGTGMPIVRGSAGFGFNLGAAYKILSQSPLYLGADFGFSIWSFRYLSYYYEGYYPGVSVSAFHFLLSTKYVHALEHNLRLSGGLSIGPSFASTNIPFDSSVLFTFLLRPGIQFDISKNFLLGVETNFGIVGSSFAFYPLISAIFSI